LFVLTVGFAVPPLAAVYLMLGEQGNLPRWLTPPQRLISFLRGRSAPEPPRPDKPHGSDSLSNSPS
jgi:hypothetical protein